jgi:predicted nuclease of restriction endonuclease-like (RecB) superfamily
MKNNSTLSLEQQDFEAFLNDIKNKVSTAQQKAILAVNSELVILYWEIGNEILQNQTREGWGSKIIDSLSKELQSNFPLMKGLSVRNLKYMRQFASLYTDKPFVQEVLAQMR